MENQLLDAILLTTSKLEGIYSYHLIEDKLLEENEWVKEINTDLIFSGLKKLVKDGYVILVEDSIKNQIFNGYDKTFDYYISFEGTIFIKNGGYCSEFERKENEKTEIKLLKEEQEKLQIQQLKISKTTKQLTYLITIGTIIAAIYYGLEIYYYFDNHPLAKQSFLKNANSTTYPQSPKGHNKNRINTSVIVIDKHYSNK